MSYFVNNINQIKLNEKTKNLELEKIKIANNLTKYQNELAYFKHPIFLHILKSRCQKLELLISKEEILKQNNYECLNLISKINAKIHDLIVILHTKGTTRSIFDKSTYYECQNLYNTIYYEISLLCQNTEVKLADLKELFSSLEKAYMVYSTVDFISPNFDYQVPLNLEDFDLYLEFSSFAELICNSFREKLTYEEFLIHSRKYLTIEATTKIFHARKIDKKSCK